MTINWIEVNRAFYPMKGYEDFQKRWQESLSYPFVREAYNYSMPKLAEYTRQGVGADPKGRYKDYTEKLLAVIDEIGHAGVRDILDLWKRVQTREDFALFSESSSMDANDIALLLKYLSYWFIPAEKYLGGLVRPTDGLDEPLRMLRGCGVRTNMELLQQCQSEAGRRTLATSSGLPLETVTVLVHRADLSRMPWASKATISNILGAGCVGLSALASAEPEALFTAFYDYGKSIQKNLKLGNEIENSHRIARIVPAVLVDGW